MSTELIHHVNRTVYISTVRGQASEEPQETIDMVDYEVTVMEPEDQAARFTATKDGPKKNRGYDRTGNSCPYCWKAACSEIEASQQGKGKISGE